MVSLSPTNAEVRLVDVPHSKSIYVSLNRVRSCFEELSCKGTSPRKYDPRPVN